MIINEVNQILRENFTVEELAELLDLQPEDLIDGFQDKIEEHFDKIVERIREDLGYDDEDET
jgi:transcriptional regulator GlxA family with amidase domain